MMFHRAQSLLVLGFALVVSCRGDRKPAKPDSAVAVSPVEVLPMPVTMNPGWESSSAGPVMLLSVSDVMAQAAVILPSITDSALSSASSFRLDSLSGLPVDLFDRSGAVASAILRINSQAATNEGCLAWPAATIEGAIGHWRVGLRQNMAKALPLDSLEGIASADSIRVTTELARLASALSETSDPVFQGLPFAVRKAYRFTFGTTAGLIGDVVRKINEEANPREEHLLLIAERPSASDGNYVTVFHSKAAGPEEMVRTNDILSAVQFVSSGRPAVIVSFDYEDGGRIALIERAADGAWKITWRSAYTGC